MKTMFAGFGYIWSEKIVLGAISLDLFAVLLSGAAALLPIYARDILQLAPGASACCARHPASAPSASPSGWPAHPLRNHAGMIMLCSAASFGAFTVLFGLSTIT